MQHDEFIERVRRPAGLASDAEHLERRPPERSEIFSLGDFLQVVGEGVGPGEAEARARAVVGVLGEAVSGGEMEDVRRQFPSAFDPSSSRAGGSRRREGAC